MPGTHLKKRNRNIIIVGEDLNFLWDEKDIKEAEDMYKAGIPLYLIADNFGRPDIEVAIMIMWRGETGHIKANDFGSRKVMQCIAPTVNTPKPE
jgi:hypothetical protein